MITKTKGYPLQLFTFTFNYLGLFGVFLLFLLSILALASNICCSFSLLYLLRHGGDLAACCLFGGNMVREVIIGYCGKHQKDGVRRLSLAGLSTLLFSLVSLSGSEWYSSFKATLPYLYGRQVIKKKWRSKYSGCLVNYCLIAKIKDLGIFFLIQHREDWTIKKLLKCTL